MSEIADFLRARYTEQRATAEAAAASSSMNWCPGDRFLSDSVTEVETGAAVVIGPWEHLDHDLRQHIASHDPAAVIADLDAKLAIVDLAARTLKFAVGDSEVDHYGALDLADRALGLLAQPFARHPDYRRDWAA